MARFQEVGDMVPALELILGRTAPRRIQSGEALCDLATWWLELRSPTKGDERESESGFAATSFNLELQTDLGFWLRIQGRAEPPDPPPPPISLAQLSHFNAGLRAQSPLPLSHCISIYSSSSCPEAWTAIGP